VSYHGQDFDLDFLADRLYHLGADNAVADADLEPHIDVFADRKAVCDRTGQKWPKLEECLASYDFAEPVTEWDGRRVDNTRFGEELGPAYLAALADGDDRADELREVIDHYLVTDLEANQRSTTPTVAWSSSRSGSERAGRSERRWLSRSANTSCNHLLQLVRTLMLLSVTVPHGRLAVGRKRV